VEESGAVYDQAIQRLDEVFPEVARQIRDEVARGRAVRARKLAASEIAEREGRMKDANAGKIGLGDVAVVPYTADERLRILVEALTSLASTMASGRRSLVGLIGDGRERVVEFVGPGADDSVTIDIATEARNVEAAQLTVARLLESVLAALEADA
jgi:hypothetical protein